MTIPNSTYRLLIERLGGTSATEFVGNSGDLFYDPNNPIIKLSDGVSVGGLSVGADSSSGVNVVNSIDELQGAEVNNLVFVSQYYIDYDAEADLALISPTEKRGGGIFYWDPEIPKTRHDGGLFISPTVPYDGTRAELPDFLNGVGETDPTGNGVWVRLYTGHIMAEWFGCVSNRIADDQPSIQKALDTAASLNRIPTVGEGNIGKTRTVEIVGSCRVKKFLAVGASVTLYGQGNTLSYPNQDQGFANPINTLSGPTIYADVDCELFTGRANRIDQSVIMLLADSSRLDGIVVDGYDLPFGTWYPSINCRSANNEPAVNSFEGELKVIDPDDDRQRGNLRIITEQVPAFQMGDSWFPGFQLDAAGGNRTGVGVGTTTYTSVSPAAPYQWDVISGTLPSGISVSKSGWITCSSPTAPSSVFIRLRVADADGSTKEKDLIFEVKGKYINPVEGGLPPATINSSYEYQCSLVNANDTTVPHRWWLINGPEGLAINPSTGIITGTPTSTSFGEYKLKIGITTTGDEVNFDANELIDSIEYDFLVENDPFPRLFNRNLGTTNIGVAFTAIIYPAGGTPPFTWTINPTAELPVGFQNDQPGYPTSSSPAPGLTLTTDGVRGIISGTPTTSGNFNFQVVATDSQGRVVSDLIILRGSAFGQRPQLKLAKNWNLPVAVKGQPYSYQVEATQNNCTFSVAGRGLPSGLSISSSGLISGTPTGGRVANGVSCSFGAKVYNVNIRNFKNGTGLNYSGATNVHIAEKFFINGCDIGIGSNNLFDSRFETFYIYGCRIGMQMGGGTAANTYINGRIEYIYEYGVSALFANDNIFSAVYWDTCGLAGITAESCSYWDITGCIFYRSGRRVPPRGRHYSPDSYEKWSTHINLLKSSNMAIGSNTFIRGSEVEGGSQFLRAYEESGRRDWVRPYTCLTVEDTEKIVVSGNSMAGCTNRSVVSSVVPFELVSNDLLVENNIVQVKNGFSSLKSQDKKYDNVFANANKSDFTSEGNNEDADEFYNSTSLLLHGNELVDRSFRAYSLSSTAVTINTSISRIGSGSLSFDGTTSVLNPQVSDNSSTSAGFYFGHKTWTIELQIYPFRNNVPQTLIDFGTNNESTTFAIALDANGKLVLARNRTTGGQTTDYVSSSVIPINTWTRIIVCKTGGSNADVRVYIEENLDATLTTEFDNRFIISGFNRPTIGRGGFTSAADFYQGLIQELRITNNVSRHGTQTTIPAQTKPYADLDFGVVPPNSLIYSPKLTTQEFFWGQRSYSLSLGPTSSITKFARITRRDKSDIIGELRLGKGSYASGQKNPSDYYYNIVKAAEAGTTPGTYAFQQCELRLWLSRLGNTKDFNALRGKRLNIVFYARSNNLNRLPIFTEFYAGTADNAFKVDGGFFTVFTLTPFWRKYYFELDFPDYELTRLNSSNCNSYFKFNMDDKSVSYDWDLGGLMVYPADGTFGYRSFVE